MDPTAGLRLPVGITVTDHFSILDDHIGPQPWMQLRSLDTVETNSVSKSYDPSNGQGKNELIQTLELDWTNNSPVRQWVYGMVTRGGAKVTLQTRSRGYLTTSHGVLIGAGEVPMSEVSRFGTGADIGVGGLLAIGAAFSIAELRENSCTVPLLPAHTGLFLVEPGDTIHARVEVRFKSEFWENTNINGGDSGTESSFISGELRLDLFAVPTIVEPPPRTLPTVVGGRENVQSDRSFNSGFADNSVAVPRPEGLQTGDTLVAVVCNQWGLCSDMTPYDEGWTLAHQRNEGLFGLGDVHLRIWVHTVADPEDEPLVYGFRNPAVFAEMIAAVIPLRGAQLYDGGEGSNWYVASNLSRFRLVEEQVAPSVDRAGQFLLALSYLNHEPWQTPLVQAVPEGMEELIGLPWSISSLSIAFLSSPPKPTFPRRFEPNNVPLFTGHSIAATIVVPGEQVI